MSCSTCGHPIDGPQVRFCPNCGAPLVPPAAEEPAAPPPLPGAPSPGPEAEQPSSVPFEDGSRPFLQRWWETFTLSLSNPAQLFSNLKDDNLGLPVLYAVIMGTVAGVFASIWQILFGGMFAFLDEGALEGFAVSGIFTAFIVVFMPLFVIVWLFVWTAIYHLCLLLLGTESRGFGVTLRAVAYGYGPQLFAIVPFCGGFVGGIWTLVLTILGAYWGHRTDAWRAVLAYFLPLVVCCGIATMLWFLIVGIAISQGGM